jgi:DNA-binding transcriptional regulator PaaX
MAKHSKEIVKLSAVSMLFKLAQVLIFPYTADYKFRVKAEEAIDELDLDRTEIQAKIRYLKKIGLIETFVENKERYFEITARGFEKLKKHQDKNPVIKRSEKWDSKWRVVIFDVPDKKKFERDTFRSRLLEMGFVKVQESVYVYPFECTNIIRYQSELLLIEKYVLVMVSEIIQGEEEVIEKFLTSGILQKNDLRK